MIGAIVLAAGESRRMGTQKLLLPYAGKTVIAHIVDKILECGLGEVVVVTGSDRDAVEGALAPRDVMFAFNPEVQRGMLSSLRIGLKALSPQVSGVLVVLGDQPAVQADVVRLVLQAFDTDPRSIVVPISAAKRGHPLLFSARFIPEVLERFDDSGLRGLLHAQPDAVREVEAGTDTVLSDMDYPDDYASALRALESAGEEA